MNESDFEKELRALEPIAPSAALESRIDAQLPSRHALATVEAQATIIRRGRRAADEGWITRLLPGLGWAFAGAAAALTIASSVQSFDKPARTTLPAEALTAIEPDFEPEGISREMVSAEDDGVVYADEQEPARLVRYNSLERHLWIHPVTGARLEIEIPREDVVLMPVAMQ